MENNRRNAGKHYRKLRALAKIAQGKSLPWLEKNADVARRALVERPPEVATEEEQVAYFRGFVAGAKRSADESERFERLKDLCHRIAAEKGIGYVYEERLSAAYEGLLGFIRRRKTFDGLEHERAAAAVRIRGAIVDQARASGDFGRTGKRRNAKYCVSQLGHKSVDGPAVPENIEPVSPTSQTIDLSFLEAINLDDRTRRILADYATGYTMKEIGAGLNLTESRIYQIIRDVGAEHPELEKLLADCV